MKNKILLVEDEEDTATLLKSILEREGFSVIRAKDGRQANTLVDTIRPPSLILLDLILPYISGSELLQIIRHHPDWQRTPVIIVSADSHGPDKHRALNNGATGYVLKQKGAAALLKEIREILPPLIRPASGASQPVTTEATAVPRKRRKALPPRPQSSQRRKRAAS